MEKRRIVRTIGVILILSSAILSILSVVIAFTVHNQQNAYLRDENIYFESFSVKMDDGIQIKGFMYVDTDLEKKTDSSVPSILLIHGINGRKERDFEKVFQLVKLGYAVFSVELRGHGESGGISGFIGKEPHDMVQVVDFIEKKYDFANASQIGLLAFSYGGGVAIVLQAIDDRVFAAVIYHPLASIDRLLDKVPFERLIGITPAIKDVKDIEDGFDVCTPKNTENLLLIQGENDDLILPEDTKDLYDQVNGSERDDIGLEIRPGLNHGQNEADEGSFKFTLVWFEHFYHDLSINITNREEEADNIELIDNNFPESSIPETLIMIAAIALFVSMSVLILPTKVWPLSKQNLNAVKIDPKAYKKTLQLRVMFYFLPAIVGGLFCAIFNPSYFYGYFLAIPMTTIILMLFIHNPEFPDWKSEWKDWYKNDLKPFSYSIWIIIVPIILYVLIFNWDGFLTKRESIPLFTTTSLIYLAIIFSLIFSDYLLIRGWKFKHTILLIGLQPLTLFVFYLFVPIPPFSYLGGMTVHILVLSLIGIVFWVILFIITLLRKIFKSRITVVAILFLPLLVFLMYRFFRII